MSVSRRRIASLKHLWAEMVVQAWQQVYPYTARFTPRKLGASLITATEAAGADFVTLQKYAGQLPGSALAT